MECLPTGVGYQWGWSEFDSGHWINMTGIEWIDNTRLVHVCGHTGLTHESASYMFYNVTAG